MTGIYKIKSPSGGIYIGQTRDYKTRYRCYKNIRCYNQSKLYNSLVKYGFKEHIIELICELPDDISQKTLNDYEIFYYEKYKDCGFKMLNIKYPGSNGSHSEDTKKLLSIRNTGYKFTEQQVRNLSMAKKGKKLSEEHKQKLRQAFLGKYNGSQNIKFFINGELYDSIGQASKKLNIPSKTIHNRLNSKNIKFNNYLYQDESLRPKRVTYTKGAKGIIIDKIFYPTIKEA